MISHTCGNHKGFLEKEISEWSANFIDGINILSKNVQAIQIA